MSTKPQPGAAQPKSPQPSPQNAPAIDEHKMQMLVQRLRDNQNFGMGIVGGAGGAVAGSILWALITYATGWQIGFMAVGVGFMVGWGIRKFGQGVDKSFGMLGAVLSLLGCAFGNLLTACVYIAAASDVSVLAVIAGITPEDMSLIMIETFHPMDLLFYGLAVYYGYKYAFRPLTEDEITAVSKA